jgi:hypothetical protein
MTFNQRHYRTPAFVERSYEWVPVRGDRLIPLVPSLLDQIYKYALTLWRPEYVPEVLV